MVKKDKAQAQIEEEQAPPPPPEPEIILESDRIRLEIEEGEVEYRRLEASGSASNTELLSKRQVQDARHIELRKALFSEQIEGNHQLFEALNLIKQNRLPPNFDLGNLPKIVEMQQKIAASEELVKDFVSDVIKSKAQIESIRTENQKVEVELKALQSRLTDSLVRNNERIKEENRHIRSVLGDVVEKSPIWVAYHYPDMFRELTGIIVTSAATAPTTPTTERSIGAKPSDLSADEHEQMLKALDKAAVEAAISEGASKDSNKEILDKVAMKVFGKTFNHYGSLDSKVYNIRGALGWR